MGAIRGTSKEKLYNGLGLETLEKRRWYRKLLLFKDFQIRMSKVPIQYYSHFCEYSDGCNLVNWLSQTRRNLTIEYLNLNSVTTPKLTLLHSIHFMRKRFLFLAFGSFPFRECVHVQAFSIPIFCSIPFRI